MDFRKDLLIRAWPEMKPEHVALLKKAGVRGVLLRSGSDASRGFLKACTAAGIETVTEAALGAVKPEGLTGGAQERPHVALASGLWPGIARGPSKPNSPDDETASASREPWIDANSYWVAVLRAMYPKSAAAVMAYEPNEAAGLKNGRVVGYETLEIAYAEARAAGGNFVLALESGYRDGLIAGEAKAVAAWDKLAVTAEWFRENDALFNGSAQPAITTLVDGGEESAELANLLFRRNASPSVVAVQNLPASPVAGLLALNTAGLKTAPGGELAARILSHAERGGATVVTDDPAPWWKRPGMKEIRRQEDRVFYSLGKGTVIAYHERIMNPSEFALDMIDVVTHAKRPVRLWNTFTVIALAGAGGVLHLLNYAAPRTDAGAGGGGRRSSNNLSGGGGNGSEIQVRYQGHFAKAKLLTPGAAPRQLETAHRGSTTEVYVPQFERVATVVFS